MDSIQSINHSIYQYTITEDDIKS